jgi:hypothetical protein
MCKPKMSLRGGLDGLLGRTLGGDTGSAIRRTGSKWNYPEKFHQRQWFLVELCRVAKVDDGAPPS